MIKLLKNGSYGYVYLIEDKITKIKYALKKISYKNRQNLKDYKNEISILKNINSNYIIKIYDYFIDKKTLNIIIEYAPFGDLYEYIMKYKKNKKKFSKKKIRKIITSITYGIQDLHKYNILHRDIKPSNILICKNFNIKLTDFGSSTYNYNLHYTFIGTPCYMSPEMIQHKKYTYSIDIWAIGCIFYELITLYPPFYSKFIRNLYNKILRNNKLMSNIPYYYKSIIKGLLNINPKQRFTLNDILVFFEKEKQLEKINNNINKKINNKIKKLENDILNIRRKSIIRLNPINKKKFKYIIYQKNIKLKSNKYLLKPLK